ncbi:MAG: MOSC domain-containing protein, partial [Chloroflexales bacterium]|nr:MOSC domain-containing protein [Chloroflexales bacterium]
HVASAKHPRKWARLFACQATFAPQPRPDAPLPPVLITLPDGFVVSSAQPDIDRVLSRALGREVSLITDPPAQPTREANRAPVDADPSEETINEEPLAIAAPPGTFFDYAVLHIITTVTLDALQACHPAGQFAARRFRPNILVAPADPTPRFAENAWIGGSLAIGGVRLHVIDPSPRCIVTTLPQGDLPHDPGILRTIAQQNSAPSATLAPGVVMPAVAGVYASVVRGGMLHVGDTLAH